MENSIDKSAHDYRKKETKNLVIIGGGFAGSTLARALEKRLPRQWEIYLLSKTNFVTYNPLLPEVVGASVLPGHVQAPLRLMVKRTRIRMVDVDRVDFRQKKVYYHNNEPGELAFDQLIFAAGVGANMVMMDGLREHTLPLKTVGDALHIRNRIIECLEYATIHPDPSARKMLTSFIIIGGGFSGVEVAGEMHDFLLNAVRYYKNVGESDIKLTIIHSANQLLPEFPEKLGKKTERIFRKQGIEIYLNARAARISANRVELTDGRIIEAGTIICTIGTTPRALCQNDELPLQNGKIITEGDMSVSGVEGIWALGDCALVPNAADGKFCPPTAQFAVRQAHHLAKNITAGLAGRAKKPFSYTPKGMLAGIGYNNAVAEIYGIRVSGLAAFLIWRAIYLLKVPTLSRKVRLFLEWTWTMFFPPDIAHLGFKRTDE